MHPLQETQIFLLFTSDPGVVHFTSFHEETEIHPLRRVVNLSPVCATANLFCASLCRLLHHPGSKQVARNPYTKRTRGKGDCCRSQGGEHIAPTGNKDTQKGNETGDGDDNNIKHLADSFLSDKNCKLMVAQS